MVKNVVGVRVVAKVRSCDSEASVAEMVGAFGDEEARS